MQAIQEVVLFELARTLTRGRMLTWMLLACFPSLLMILLQSQAHGNIPAEPLALMTFYLVPQIGCMLGLLLWATPAVGSELEAQTWVYIAMRPHGRLALVLGKYVIAVGWSMSAGLVSACGVAVFSRFDSPFQLGLTLSALVVLSSFCYGSLFLLIGIAISRRATVFAVVYSLIMEGLVSVLPATINQLTVCYRLRALLSEWVGLDLLRSSADNLFGYEPVWQHLGSLLLYVLTMLLLSILVVQTKEYAVQGDN